VNEPSLECAGFAGQGFLVAIAKSWRPEYGRQLFLICLAHAPLGLHRRTHRATQPKLTTPLACTPFRESTNESPAVMNQWSKLS
jgi:hypothetical protein